MALLILLTMGGLYFFISNLTPGAVEARRQQQTEEALAQARDALIGYALQYRDQQTATGTLDAMYGFLPMPDVGTSRFHTSQTPACNTEGCAMSFVNGAFPSTTETVVGRFPWRTLGTGPLRDGYSECLWYLVSAGHKSLGMDANAAMNWDTLGQIDIVTTNDTADLQSVIANAHNRPIAIIFSPGPLLGNQVRGQIGSDVVTECGGNYNPANYLEPSLAAAILDNDTNSTSNYFTGTIPTDTSPTTLLAISTQGKIVSDGTNLKKTCPDGTNCDLVANDTGLPITSDLLFGAIRKSSYFRADINAMLERMTSCLRDRFAAGGTLTLDANSSDLTAASDKIAGRIPDDTCYDDSTNPRGYFGHYKELVFVAKPNAGNFSVNGESCGGVLLFSSQRGLGQSRITSAEKHTFNNYLEGENLTSFTTGGSAFSGASVFERVSTTQSVSLDIARCVSSSPSFYTLPSPGLAAAGIGQLTNYSAATRTLTLGQEVSSSLSFSLASDLFGCAWSPETHAMGGGLRSYFTFRINDSEFSSSPHEGFTFAMVDGDSNGINACGAARQHLGYSGNNLDTPFIAAPKIALEIDPRREGTFDPTLSNTLSNGRNDPSYNGGHVAIDYWGGERTINTGLSPPCTPPRIVVGTRCHLPAEEDDNVHGQTASARSGFPAPPANPLAPALPLAVPPDTPAGVYKLNPSLSGVPINRDVHARVELTRATATHDLPRVRVGTTGNLDLAAPGATIDGVVLVAGDRVLIKDQAAPSENGIYTWNGSASLMTRATDADSTIELAGMLVEVAQGTVNARSIWRQTAINAALGTDPILWANAQVKIATPSNINLASPGATIDGIMMATIDRVLVKAQTVTSENGIYLWNGATSPMTRAADADPAAELMGMVVQVQQGTNATAWWRYDGAAWSRLSVRVATQAAINLASPGASIDGITLSANDRVLVKEQASQADNGIYQWTGSSSAMVRVTDADEAAEIPGTLTHVQSGTDTGRAFRQTSFGATGTLGVTAVQWVAIDSSPNFLIEIWILPESATDANKIAAMKNTTRPMSVLYPTFVPHLRDDPVIGYPFRNVRLGFTTGQRTSITDQTFAISNFFTTWLD